MGRARIKRECSKHNTDAHGCITISWKSKDATLPCPMCELIEELRTMRGH